MDLYHYQRLYIKSIRWIPLKAIHRTYSTQLYDNIVILHRIIFYAIRFAF